MYLSSNVITSWRGGKALTEDTLNLFKVFAFVSISQMRKVRFGEFKKVPGKCLMEGLN